MTDNLMFASIDIPMIDKTKVLNEIYPLIGSKDMFWEPYRGLYMLPLLTKGAASGVDSMYKSNGFNADFVWSSFTPPTLKEYFQDVVFPWAGTDSSRIMLLLTPGGTQNKDHIDSRLREVGMRKHKFRIVLQGTTDTLYYITKSGIVNAPKIDTPFLMDGSWPHGLDNTSEQMKITIAFGSPWEGRESYGREVKVLLDRSDYELPENLGDYAEKHEDGTYK
jgi:hypothetical protein